MSEPKIYHWTEIQTQPYNIKPEFEMLNNACVKSCKYRLKGEVRNGEEIPLRRFLFDRQYVISWFSKMFLESLFEDNPIDINVLSSIINQAIGLKNMVKILHVPKWESEAQLVLREDNFKLFSTMSLISVQEDDKTIQVKVNFPVTQTHETSLDFCLPKLTDEDVENLGIDNVGCLIDTSVSKLVNFLFSLDKNLNKSLN